MQNFIRIPNFIRINEKVVSVLPDGLFWIIYTKLNIILVKNNLQDNLPLKKFSEIVAEYGADFVYSPGTKQKLDIAEIFKNHPQDLKLLINFLNEIALSIKEEISEPEFYALNGTIEKIQKYYESICMPK